VAARFRVEVLGPEHARDDFSCGVEALDRYLARQVGQDVRRRVNACYVAVEGSSSKVAGYYTLSADGVLLSDLPATLAKRLPRYPSVPVARVGRLAVDHIFHGQGLGGALIADAAIRAIRSEVVVFAMVVDAKDDAAVAFYRHHGFESFGGKDRQMIISLKHFAAKPE
jgi:ribosomal protein S18 acetylase RimI-like enzyme